MEISPIKIFYMSAASLVFGMIMGMFNDVNRILRMLLGIRYSEGRFEFLYNIKLPISRRTVGKPKTEPIVAYLTNFIIFLQDVVLFTVSGAGIAVLNYYFNNGRARLYTPFAVALGFIIYYFTFGKTVLYFSDIAIFLVKFVFLTFFEIMYYPIGAFVRFFGIFVKKLHTFIEKTIAKKQKKVYNISKEKNVMNSAVFGFIDLTK